MEHYQASPLKYKLKSPFLVGLVIVITVSLLRYHQDIFSNETWAEESTDFLVNEIFRDVGIFTPAASTLFVLERGFAKLALSCSLLFAPLIIHIQCFLVYALVAAYFSRQSFRWIVPSDLLRIVACIMIAVAPGSNEVIANIPCLPYVIALGLGLTLLENREVYSSKGYQIGFVLSWILGNLSSHISSVLIPLALVKLLSGVSYNSAPDEAPKPLVSSNRGLKWPGLVKGWAEKIIDQRNILLLALPVITASLNLIVHTIIALQESYKITTPVVNPPLMIIKAIVGNFLTTSILSVVSGFPATFPSSLLTIWDLNPLLVFVFSSAIALSVIITLWRTRRLEQSQLGLGLMLSGLFLFVIHSVARGSYLQSVSDMPFTVSFRHFWLPYGLSMITIMGPFLHWARGFSIKWGVYVLVLSAVTGSMLNISFSRQPKQVSWGEFVRQLEAGAPQATLVAIDDWAKITVFKEEGIIKIRVVGGNR